MEKSAAQNCWLVKQEPGDYPWSKLVLDGKTSWTGVRNFLARNHLRAMHEGDRVFYYHSGEGKEVVGIAKVARTAYPDPTAKEGDGDWSAVDLKPVKPFKTAVTLATIKADAVLKGMMLVRQSRLSVSQVTPTECARLLELSNTPA